MHVMTSFLLHPFVILIFSNVYMLCMKWEKYKCALRKNVIHYISNLPIIQSSLLEAKCH